MNGDVGTFWKSEADEPFPIALAMGWTLRL